METMALILAATNSGASLFGHEWIEHRQSLVDDLAMLQILTIKCAAFSLQSGGDDHRVIQRVAVSLDDLETALMGFDRRWLCDAQLANAPQELPQLGQRQGVLAQRGGRELVEYLDVDRAPPQQQFLY